MFSVTDYIKHQLSLSFWNLPATKSNDMKESSFCMIAHRLFFLRDTCWSRFNFEFVQTHRIIWLQCGKCVWSLVLPWLEQHQNIQRELHQHSWEHFKRVRCIDPASPLSLVCEYSIFSCTNKTRSFHQYAENMVSTMKHKIITEKNNKSSPEMKMNYIHA